MIVGGGSAGCVLADRLSASGRHRVLVIEAGGRDRNPWLHIPIGYGKLMRHPGLDWGFETVPQPQLDDRRIAAPRGRVLGGSSATNGLAYIRGQAEDYDAWARAGNIGWGYADLLPYFRRGEDQQRGADRYHGVGGPLLVSDPPRGFRCATPSSPPPSRRAFPKTPTSTARRRKAWAIIRRRRAGGCDRAPPRVTCGAREAVPTSKS